MVRNLDMRRVALRMAVPSLLVAAVMVFVVAQLGGGSREVADAQVVPSDVGDASSVPGISAVGVGQVQAAGEAAYSLSAGVQEQSSGDDVQAAVQGVQDKIAAIQSAIEGAGVPSDKIVMTGFNIGPSYPPYPIPLAKDSVGGSAPSIEPSPPDMQGSAYMVSANLQVDTDSPEQLAAAMQVAIGAGATSVSTFRKGGPQEPPPDPDTLKPAIQQATEQAKAMAQASAEAAGLDLGDIRSVSVQPPMAIFTGPSPSASYWQVQVSVTYDIQR
jgi:uncharacterized protein YggE